MANSRVDWKHMLAHGWNYTCLKCRWVGAASVEHVAIEIMIVIAGIASSAVSAKIDGKDVATAAVWGTVGGACAILAILVFYWTIAGSQIHHTANTRICKLEQQVTSRNERLAFIRQSLLGIADEIRKFDDAFGTFAPPTCALQNFGISLIRASLKCGRTVARDFMTTTQMRVEFENDKQLRLTQRLSVVEFERIAESVNDDDILPEFCKETWLVDSLDDHKQEGEVILSACLDNPDIAWQSKRDLWSGHIRFWIEIFVSGDAAQTFMSNIDYNDDRSRLESFICNLAVIRGGIQDD